MISKADKVIIWWLRIQSLGWALFVVLLGFLTTEVGSYNTASYGDGSNQNGDSSLCRVVRNIRNSLLTSFKDEYTASNFFCDISDHCANVTCAAEFSRGRINAGLLLKLCEPDPELDYWVDLPGQWEEPWVHTFSSKRLNGHVQRVEIGSHNGTSIQPKPTKWFLTVVFSITPGRLQSNRATKHISIQSVLQICQSEEVSSCRNTTLLNFPKLPQSQVCYSGDEPSSLSSSWGSGDSLLSSSRSSRNANAWNPEAVHSGAHERARKFETGRPWPEPGDKCDLESILACGKGAACEAVGDGSGTCNCMSGHVFVNSSSGCVTIPPTTPAPLGPSSDSESDSRSYSSAIGAILAILILVAIAAGIFFGTKYHYFDRIRHRIPVLRCWPFRRHQPWEDNLTMDRF